MGSVIGAFYAMGQLEAFKDLLFSTDRKAMLSLVDFTIGRSGLVPGKKIMKKMQEIIPDACIEDLDLPYLAVAADLVHNQEVVFRSGSVYDAIRASIAIPSVFTPVKSEGRIMVDGGVMNNIPLDHVHRTPGDLLVGVNVNADLPFEGLKPEREKGESRQFALMGDFHLSLLGGTKSKKGNAKKDGSAKQKQKDLNMGYISLASRSLDVLMMNLAEKAIQLNPPDILIEISRESAHLYDFYRGKELMEVGRLSAKKVLENRKT
jgi:NTE family protein